MQQKLKTTLLSYRQMAGPDNKNKNKNVVKFEVNGFVAFPIRKGQS